MPRVKIVRVEDTYSSYDEYSHETIQAGLSNWEEISEDDLALLRSCIHRVPCKRGHLVICVDEPAPTTFISSIKALLAEDQRKLQLERDARKEKSETAAKKRLAKKEAEEKALLEKLQAKYSSQQ
jgi:hypothetical protein